MVYQDKKKKKKELKDVNGPQLVPQGPNPKIFLYVQLGASSKVLRQHMNSVYSCFGESQAGAHCCNHKAVDLDFNIWLRNINLKACSLERS